MTATENRTRVRAYLHKRGCADCGEDDPDVLDFHHLRDKDANVSALVQYASWERIWVEIAKCVVLCANDHRKRHAREREALAHVRAGYLEWLGRNADQYGHLSLSDFAPDIAELARESAERMTDLDRIERKIRRLEEENAVLKRHTCTHYQEVPQ